MEERYSDNLDTFPRARKRGQRLTRKERRALKQRFLQTYALRGLNGPPLVNAICQELHISRACVYAWTKNDPRFEAKYLALQSVFYLPWPLARAYADMGAERAICRKMIQRGRRLIQSYQRKHTSED